MIPIHSEMIYAVVEISIYVLGTVIAAGLLEFLRKMFKKLSDLGLTSNGKICYNNVVEETTNAATA